MPDTLHVERLTPANLPRLLAFFEGPAFSDNPKWGSCFCAYNYLDHQVVHWAERGASENRATTCQLVAAGRMQGLLAIADDKVIGWINAAPRSHYPGYVQGNDNDARTGVLTCFVIAPERRRQGIASRLLEAACAEFAAQGMIAVEAWPNRAAESAAAHYHGPLSMYLAHGFAATASEPDDSELQCVCRPLPVLRAARVDDAPILAELSDQLGYPTTAQQTAQRVAALPASERVLVASFDDVVRGWVQVGCNHSIESVPHAEIRGLIIDQRWRGRGLGQALVAAAAHWARREGFTELRVRSKMERAATHAFYRARGFHPVKQQQVFALKLADHF